MNLLLRTTSVLALGLATASCETPVPQVLAPKYVPSTFTSPTAPAAEVWPKADWWKGFGSDQLDGLIATAQTDNLDLAAAAARVLQAEAQSEISGSALFPSITLDGSAQRARNGSGGVSVTSSGVTTRPVTGNAFGLTVDASYELDIWGKARDNLRAADELVKASTYAQQVVALTVTADVATTYLDVLALRERLTIARQNIDAAKRILAITQAKVTNGVSSRLDLAQQQAQLSGQEAQIPALEEQEREARYALAILLGRLPEGFDRARQRPCQGGCAPRRLLAADRPDRIGRRAKQRDRFAVQQFGLRLEHRRKPAADHFRRRVARRAIRTRQGPAIGVGRQLPQHGFELAFRRRNHPRTSGKSRRPGALQDRAGQRRGRSLPHFRAAISRGRHRPAQRADGAADPVHRAGPAGADQARPHSGRCRSLQGAGRRLERNRRCRDSGQPGRGHAGEGARALDGAAAGINHAGSPHAQSGADSRESSTGQADTRLTFAMTFS